MESRGTEGFHVDVTVLYYAAFALYVFVFSLDHTNFESFFFVDVDVLYKYAKPICAALLIARMCSYRYSPLQFFANASIGVLALITYYYTYDWNPILLFLFISAGQRICIKTLAKIALVVCLFVLLVTVVFSSFGVITTRYTPRFEGGIVSMRSSMGFTHPNQFGQAVLSICIAVAIIDFPVFHARRLFVYGIAAVLCYEVADSRTSVVCILLVVLMSFISWICIKKNKSIVMAIAAIVIVAASVCLSFYMMINYTSSVAWMRELNRAIAQRFYLANWYYLSYPPRLFGRPIGTFLYATRTFVQHGPDNAFVRMLLQDGWITTVIFIGVYLLTLVRLWRLKRFDVCSFGLMMYAIVAITESNSIFFAANYFLAGASCLLYGATQYMSANPMPGVSSLPEVMET